MGLVCVDARSLYCQRREKAETCDLSEGRACMVDGISMSNTAAGPNALEADSSIDGPDYLHVSGVQSVDGVVNTQLYNYEMVNVSTGVEDDNLGLEA
jgi:hypothetical protein